MSGTESAADSAMSSPSSGRTVQPAVLAQKAPAVRYINPSQSNIIMESGTKSPNVSNPISLT